MKRDLARAAAYERSVEAHTMHVAHAAWCFAWSVLWQDHHFINEGRYGIVEELKEIFSYASDSFDALVEFCERVLLMDIHLHEDEDWKRFAVPPKEWLDPNNPEGFRQTTKWMVEMDDSISTDQCLMKCIALQYADYVWEAGAENFENITQILQEGDKKQWPLKVYRAMMYYHYWDLEQS